MNVRAAVESKSSQDCCSDWKGERKLLTMKDGLKIAVERRWRPATAHVTPILCCNGVGVSTFFWSYMQRDFCAQRPVITWDYRGHGDSELPKDFGKLSIEQNAEDLVAILDALGVEKAILVGHSMGCQVIMETALRAPDRVAALVPMLGTYGKPVHTFFNSPVSSLILFRGFHSLVVNAHRPLQQVTAALANMPTARALISLGARSAGLVDSQRMPPELLGAYIHHMGRLDPRVFARMAEKMAMHSVESRLDEIIAPTLVVAGTRDLFTPLYLSEELADRLPDAELLVIQEGSHAAQVEQPDLIRWRMESFLSARGL